MTLDTLLDFVTVTANLLTLSAAVGILFGVILQPRRERANWLFALFLFLLAVWAYTSLILRVPSINLFTRAAPAFYLYLTGLMMTPIAFFYAATAFCNITHRLAEVFARILLPVAGVLLVMLWAGQVVDVGIEQVPPGDGLSTILEHYTILPLGYIGMGLAVAAVLVALALLRMTKGVRARSLQIPALLLLLAYAGNFIEVLSKLPVDALLITAATSLIGYAVVSHQLFNPLKEMNDQLRAANQDLRANIDELAAQKRLTETLNDELRQASQYKSDFLAKMSHELRTPLNSIVGYSELLLQHLYGDLTEKQSDRIDKIHRNGRNLLALINDILDLSKIEAGRLELNPQQLRLADPVAEVTGTLAPLAEAKGLAFSVERDDPLRLLYADPLRVRQVLTNLLSNAIKFTHSGGVDMQLRNLTVRNGEGETIPLPALGWLSDGRWLLISVTDTGIGIAPEDHAKIFDEFRQADDSTTREYGGTGLGLAISKKLVEMHNGRIWLTSTVGAGSTFYVALPASSVPVTGPLPEDARPAAAPESTGNGAHVLVIDDSRDALDILASFLAEGGYQVTRATNGLKGLELARDLQPDIITTDIMMPGMSGWEVIRRLKADPATTHIPVVIVSIIDQKPLGVTLGAAAHINKPVERDHLLNIVQRLQPANGGGQALPAPVLVVDDNPNDREIVTEMLQAAGYRVITRSGGQEAIDWLTEHTASLIVLDLMMPQVSGFDVLAFIRETAALDTMPVLILSAKTLTPEEEDFLNGRVAEFVQKQGLAQADLLAALAKALENDKDSG